MKKLMQIASVVIIVVILGAAALGVAIYQSQKQRCLEVFKEQSNFPTHLISISDLQLNDIRTSISGRITNRSHKVLYGLSINAIAKDCSSSGCQVIGRQVFTTKITVPAGEARDFFVQQMLDNSLTQIQQRGRLQFEVLISSVSGVSDSDWNDCAGRFKE